MTVNELMTSNVNYVKEDASVEDAVKLLKKSNIGIIPVCDSKGCLSGIVTDRDIVMRALLSEKKELNRLRVSEIMTEKVFSITPEMNIHDAACVFSKQKVHRLPVLENHRLVGILSISDLAKKRIFLAEVGDIIGAIVRKN